ncbi:protein-L-isoaspartate O-methyltransferase [Xylariaceae sp. FL0594]|nr:protein-L-isoaspartate O-methyltransferase [Xylariaceae sp. FL0594]
MAWRSSGKCNNSLVENLWRNGMITQEAVKNAFLKVDRGNYSPYFPYEDSPQSIGHKATISAPHMHANAADSLLPYLLPLTSDSSAGSSSGKAASKPDSGSEGPAKTREWKTANEEIRGVKGRPRRVLDIGSGSGYLTHIFAELADEDTVVVGLEHIRELKELGEKNMSKTAEGRALLESGRVRFRFGDGRKGWVEPEELGAAANKAASSPAVNVGGPADESDAQGWDAIHVGAAAVELHGELVRQLRKPGRMFIPVEDPVDRWQQYIWVVDKDEEGKVEKKKLFGVRYVPLTDPPK